MLLILIINKMTTRTTKQKQLIENEIEKFNTFFSAEDLHDKLKKKNIGIATVYRFLNELAKQKRIHSYMCDRRKIYSKEQKSHCHFVCKETGKIIHFDIESIDFLKNKIPGKITSFQLEVRGICNKCSK